MPMKPEIKILWTSALRSGEYLQGHGFLTQVHTDSTEPTETDCCLGVLCKLAIKAGIELEREVYSNRHDSYVQYGPRREDAYLPGPVVKWAGLNGESPVVVLEDGANHYLADLNDGDSTLDDPAPWNFEQIADVIEAQL